MILAGGSLTTYQNRIGSRNIQMETLSLSSRNTINQQHTETNTNCYIKQCKQTGEVVLTAYPKRSVN